MRLGGSRRIPVTALHAFVRRLASDEQAPTVTPARHTRKRALVHRTPESPDGEVLSLFSPQREASPMRGTAQEES